MKVFLRSLLSFRFGPYPVRRRTSPWRVRIRQATWMIAMLLVVSPAQAGVTWGQPRTPLPRYRYRAPVERPRAPTRDELPPVWYAPMMGRYLSDTYGGQVGTYIIEGYAPSAPAPLRIRNPYCK